MSTRTVLFLCTGNYYRSRFAEILFNHLAQQRGLEWRADSRALAIERGIENVGDLSPHVICATQKIGLPLPPTRPPLAVSADDFRQAGRIIALKEAEHRPLLLSRHPQFADRVEYWHVHDTDLAHPEQALAEVESNVRTLVESLPL